LNYNVDHIDDLIGKYLAGEAEHNEISFLESWMKEDPSNQKHFEQCKAIFDKASSINSLQEFDTDAAWIKMKSTLTKKTDAKTVQFPDQKPYRNLTWRVAASIILVVGVGYFAYRMIMPERLDSLEVISQKETISDTLPDGSDVFLNKKTELTYAFDTKKKNHVVKLKGEAYFNIQHDDDKTFIIDAAGVFIQDIGTSFNVKAYPEANTVEVVVEEGKVMFYTDGDSGVLLSANGKGVYNKLTKTFTVEQPEENALAYKTKFFIFSNTDLQTAVHELNNVYDKKIVLGKNLSKCHLTVSFNNEDIDEIASVMAETLGLTVKKSGNEIRLEGSGCED
jgi:transmembrane sensor